MNHKIKGRQLIAALFTVPYLFISLSPTSAATANTPKEEVVYADLHTDGSVKEINVVNIFSMEKDGKITDYGDYKSVRNMTSTDEISRSGDTLTIDAKAGKLYYEGKPESSELPWDISIRYYLDGTEYSGENIAGKSGALKIAVRIMQNNKNNGSYFDDYALQVSLMLDGNHCSNIIADGATVANVGSEKQLTYTILPGNGADVEITADVSDFEMDGISFNAVPPNLEIEADTVGFMEQLSVFSDAITQLDDGAVDLKNGVSDLQNGVRTDLQSSIETLQNGTAQLQDGAGSLQTGGIDLQNGADKLQNGTAALDEGIQTLHNGIEQIQTALDTLNKQSPALVNGSAEIKSALIQLQTALNNISFTSGNLSAFISASSEIKNGIDMLVSSVSTFQQATGFDAYQTAMAQNGLDIDALSQNNAQAVNSLQTMIANLQEQMAAAQAAGADTSALAAQITQLQDMAALFNANSLAIQGTESYLTTLRQNADALYFGAAALQTGYNEFNSVVSELTDMMRSLPYQVSMLTVAINTLVSEYEKLDTGIGSYTNAVADIAAGYKQITNGSTRLAQSSKTLRTGAKDLYNGSGDLLAGIQQLYQGTSALKNGTDALDKGAASLMTGISQIYDGTNKLNDGTAAMREETADMDTKITNQIDDILSSFTGGNVTITSFVSEKNTNIERVQFVIKSDAVHKTEMKETAAEEKETLTFWQKLLHLFHF